jgi:hypothetical protein
MRKAIIAVVAAVAATSPFTASRRWRTRSHDAPPGMPSVSTSRGARRLHSVLPAAQSPAGRSKSGWSAKERSVRKIAAALAAAALTLVIVLILAAPVATAGPCDPSWEGANTGYQACRDCAMATPNDPYHRACYGGAPASVPPRNTPPPTRVPVQTPQAPPTYAPPPTHAPPSMPVQTPQVKPPTPAPPSAVPVQTPKINPPSTGGPRNAAVVSPPKRLDASPEAIEAAKSAPVTRVNPANPIKPPTQVDFTQQVQNVVNGHSGNVDVVNVGNQALVRPSHWDYVDYDVYHRPILYNPLTEAMTFRYFYGVTGAFREVYVPAGGRVVLDVATVGVFPFTAVGDSYVASGSFYGGAWIPPDGWSGPPPPDYTPPPDPAVYQDVSAYVPADDQTVQVGQVTVVGHDDSQPAGSQDAFLLDDSTLAWGQVNDPGSGPQITVAKTQSLPGVGPTDNGSILVKLAAHEQPTQPWWPWALGGGVLVVAAGLLAWLIIPRRRASV